MRTQSLLTYFGLDNNIVQLSWNDYVLRSPNLVIRALTLGCAAVILLVLVSGPLLAYLTTSLSAGPWLVRGVYAAAAIAFMLGLVGYFNIVVYSVTFPFVPLLIGVAAGLVGVGSALTAGKMDRNEVVSSGHRAVVGTLVVLVGVLAVFWATSVYATQVGREFAQSIEQSPAQRPRVTLYSEADLSMASPVSSSRITESRYAMRYTRLRLLIYADDKYMLIPENWRQGVDPVYIVLDDDTVRVEITR